MKYEKKIEEQVIQTPRHTIVLTQTEHEAFNKLLRDLYGVGSEDLDKIEKLGTVKAITLETDAGREVRLEVVVE